VSVTLDVYICGQHEED